MYLDNAADDAHAYLCSMVAQYGRRSMCYIALCCILALLLNHKAPVMVL